MTDNVSFNSAASEAKTTEQEGVAAQGGNSNTSQASTDQSNPLIIGDRVYRTTDDIAKKIQHADEHISRLEQENADFRAKLEEALRKASEARSVDDVLEAINSSKKQEGQVAQPATIDPEELARKAAQFVESSIEERSRKQREDDNFNQVSSALTKAFGDKADEQVKKIAAESDMTFDEAVLLARTKPRAFMKLFNVEPSQGVQPSTSSVNTMAMGINNTQKPQSIMSTGSTNKRVAIYEERLRQKLAGQG